MKLEFKKELVPICFFYFFLFFSFNLVFPYFTLQLRTLGLTLDDAALIGGWVTVPQFPALTSKRPFKSFLRSLSRHEGQSKLEILATIGR